MDTLIFLVGYVTQLVGSGILLREIWRKKSVYGLSADTQLCQVAATLARVVWSFDTRIVEITAAYAELCLSCVVGLAVLWSCYYFRHTASFQTVRVRWWLLMGGAAALAAAYHPGPAGWSSQILVAFTFYLEGVALLPQLLLLKKVADADNLATGYILHLVLSRVIRMGFWTLLYLQGDLFYGLMTADVLHTAACAHYIRIWFYYVRGRRGGLIAASHHLKALRSADKLV